VPRILATAKTSATAEPPPKAALPARVDADANGLRIGAHRSDDRKGVEREEGVVPSTSLRSCPCKASSRAISSRSLGRVQTAARFHSRTHDELLDFPGDRVSVGIDADTRAFAVESIQRWWQKLGRARYPNATRLVITAACGGSNGARVKLWRRELQRFRERKWPARNRTKALLGVQNEVKHRLFAFITRNWPGSPLVSYQAVVQLIGSTTETDLRSAAKSKAIFIPEVLRLATEIQSLTSHATSFMANSQTNNSLKQLFLGGPLGHQQCHLTKVGRNKQTAANRPKLQDSTSKSPSYTLAH
jgi:hypothetical protein